MICPKCNSKNTPDAPCACQPPVPLSYWPREKEADEENKPALVAPVGGPTPPRPYWKATANRS